MMIPVGIKLLETDRPWPCQSSRDLSERVILAEEIADE